MKLRFLEPAASELAEAIDHCESERPGLGQRFLAEVESTIERILLHPDGWARLSTHTRRCLTRKFPYALVYQTRENETLIVAVMHQRRRPHYWRDRIS